MLRFSVSQWVIFFFAIFFAREALALIIYRFGGEDLPLPPEVGSDGVEFKLLSWADLDPSLGGEAIEVEMEGDEIRPLKWDPNFNIAPIAEERGGEYIRPNVNAKVWDGDINTIWVAASYLCSGLSGVRHFLCTDDFARNGTANINLGGNYLIDRIRLVSGLSDPSKTVRTLRVHIADVPPPGRVDHPPAYLPYIVEIRDNRKQTLDIPIPPQKGTSFLQVAVGEHNEDWDVHEIEVYARGFVEKAAYISNIIDFERPMAWGDLRWSGVRDPGAKVLIQTRSGQDDDPDIFWRFTGRGEKAQVSRADYGALKIGEKAGTSSDQANWDFWSAPYDFADSTGAPVVSLNPRRYFQFKVDFLNLEDDGGKVDFLELRASAPVASNLVGEVWPVETRVGQPAQFTYALRPTIRAGDTGFDLLEIQTSSIVQSVEAVRLGDLRVEPEIVAQSPHRLVVRFPRLKAQDSGALVEVDFVAQVLRYGATFDVRVADSERPLEVPQGVNAGDATGDYEGNRVSVATSAREQVLLQVQVAPAVFTPNGDGFNDGAVIGYDILEITGAAQVLVEVLDLSGRPVRQVYGGEDGIGEYERVWYGRDDAGVLVLPGIYLYRILVDVDKEKVEKVGLLHITY